MKEGRKKKKIDRSLERKIKSITRDLSGAYIRARRRLYESENCIRNYPGYKVLDDEKIVYHIDEIIGSMDENAKFILDNEFKHHRVGKWYREYYSETTYYRIRKKVYYQFLEELNK